MDTVPRSFHSAQCGILGNLAELIVREVEAAWAEVLPLHLWSQGMCEV